MWSLFMIRVFVAVDLSEEVKKELSRFIDELSSKRWPVRWEAPDKLHITLFFIGWVEEEKLGTIRSAVKAGTSGISPLSIRMGQIGMFPDPVQPRVVWLGIKGDQPTLVRLRRQISNKLTDVGFEDEKRGWIPHLTIGRVKKEARYKAKKELGRQVGKLQLEEFREESQVNQVSVYQSTLSAAGSIYTKLSVASLTSSAEGFSERMSTG